MLKITEQDTKNSIHDIREKILTKSIVLIEKVEEKLKILHERDGQSITANDLSVLMPTETLLLEVSSDN